MWTIDSANGKRYLKKENGEAIAWVFDHNREDWKITARLLAAVPVMHDFIEEIAAEPCYENPGEFPESGESGQAPCRSCQARAAIAKAEGR